MSEDPDADASNGFGSMAPVLVREAALSFGDESSRAYHVGTVSHVVEEQRCACYTAEHVYQVHVLYGTQVSFVEDHPKFMLVSLVVHSHVPTLLKTTNLVPTLVALNTFNANSDNTLTPPMPILTTTDAPELCQGALRSKGGLYADELRCVDKPGQSGKGALEEGAAVMVCKKKNIKGRYCEAKVTKVRAVW